MNINSILLLPILLALLISLRLPGQDANGYIKIINAGSFELDSAEATIGIRKAIAECKATKASRLIIPKAVYHFYPSKATERYYAISNNDNGLKRIAFFIDNFQNFEIDGQGSRFIFHGKIVPFIIDNSSNVTIKNLSIDWARPFHSEGEVVAVDTMAKTFDLQMTSQFPYQIRGHELIYIGEGWSQGLQENIFFDPKTKGIAYDDTRYVMNPWSNALDYQYKAREISKGVVRIVDTIAQALPKVGWIFATKGFKEPNRLIPAFIIQKSTGLNFSDITLYHAGSMGFIAEKCENISLDRIVVKTPPQSGRYMSLGSDATHFVNCKGYISIRNSVFESMHDDAVNIQGIYTLYENIINENTIGIRLKHHQQFGFVFAEQGDSIRLVDRETLLPYKKLKVKEVREINQEYSEISFTEDIRYIIRENTALENISWYSNSVLIENCIVKNNRARSILISTPGKVIIRKNTLSSEMACISIGGEANFWAESGPVNDLLIEENTFQDCCTSKSNQAVIMVAPSIRKLVDSVFYHRNIRIVNNIFNTFDRKILTARSVDGLQFTNNRVHQTSTYPLFYPDKPSIELMNCKEVNIMKNEFSMSPVADLKTDEMTKKSMVFKRNKGLVASLQTK